MSPHNGNISSWDLLLSPAAEVKEKPRTFFFPPPVTLLPPKLLQIYVQILRLLEVKPLNA